MLDINNKTKHIVCFSGGESSSIVGLEVAKQYGTENLILLNHDISTLVESEEIKKYKENVAKSIGKEITYANYEDQKVSNIPDQFELSVKLNGFKFGKNPPLCTTFLKTTPFHNWLENFVPDRNCIIYYGFDENEVARIQRRSSILAEKGYQSDYPLALWQFKKDYNRTFFKTSDVGIQKPSQYSHRKHANCVGCIKGGRVSWYVTYVMDKEIFDKAKWAEKRIGYSIDKEYFLYELEPIFAQLHAIGFEATEHQNGKSFWSKAKKHGIHLIHSNDDEKPCECIF
ncbi:MULTISPECIES: hypothetical protein [unclassified Acinetobacter]|uniref:hypothetical protein n=1 Tax=unclassified Acinetobacter TaxID=196816 RepID=UPI0015D0E567|nr:MULTISPECIES: hypothetical protein [unclassified Acinetobacter]